MIELGINHAPPGPLTLASTPPVLSKPPKRPPGRPTVMTPDVLRKLEDAFAFCYTDEEACLYAGIGKTALYEYQKEHPAFTERKEELRLSPNLQAKKQLVEAIPGSTDQARWWAQHKMGKEFAPTSKLELDARVQTQDVTGSAAAAAVKEEYEEKLRAAISGEAGKL